MTGHIKTKGSATQKSDGKHVNMELKVYGTTQLKRSISASSAKYCHK